MKKFSPFMIAAVAMGSLAGCASETGSPHEMTAEDSAAVCDNPDGSNAAIAALATAIAQELHRWNITSDFYAYTGYAGQMMLGLTQAGLNACGGSCPMTQNILALQDSRMDLKVVFDGTKLSSWTFASRLYSGYQKQQTCQQGGWCPFVTGHVFGWTPSGAYTNFTTAAGACDTVFTFGVTKNAAGNHALLNSTEMSQLNNALVWTAANGANPYIAFQNTASTVSIDPTGQLNPPGQQTGAEICQKFSVSNINGAPCTCSANGVYANGQLKNDQSLTPMTYFCRQM